MLFFSMPVTGRHSTNRLCVMSTIAEAVDESVLSLAKDASTTSADSSFDLMSSVIPGYQPPSRKLTTPFSPACKTPELFTPSSKSLLVLNAAAVTAFVHVACDDVDDNNSKIATTMHSFEVKFYASEARLLLLTEISLLICLLWHPNSEHIFILDLLLT